MAPFAESFLASLAQYAAEEGLPPSAGRMLAWLLLQDRATSLDDVAEGLEISKSAASDHGRLLVRLGAVEVRKLPGDRKDYYEASTDLCERLLEHLLQRMEKLGSHLTDGTHIASAPPRAAARLAHVSAMSARITERLHELVRSLRDDAPPVNG